MYPTQHHSRQWLLKLRSSSQWWTHTPLAQLLRQFRGTRMLTNTMEATWMHIKVTLRPYRENKFMCDKWIQGFAISWVWWRFRINYKVLCLVYYYFIGPYIPFIFLIGYFPDILKITKIQTIFKKKTWGLLWSVFFAVLKIFETFNFP